MHVAVRLLEIYQCLGDETRLRILNLLTRGPLCVCHLQELLSAPQVKISKHLAYLRKHAVLEVQRHQNWMIYSLPEKPGPELAANLKCLRDCTQTHAVFKRDLQRLKKLNPSLQWLPDVTGCGPKSRG